MKSIGKIWIFCLLGITCSCGKKSSDSVNFNNQEIEEMLFSSIFSEVETIILETIPESIIGEISLIRYSEKYLYILDNKKSNAIFVFDLDGNFIRKIKGGYNGPGSLNYPDNFSIVGDYFLVYDSRQNKVLKYTLDGIFDEEIYLKAKNIYSLDMISDGERVLFFDFYSNPSSLFRVLDINGNIIVNEEFSENEYKVISGRRKPYLSLTINNELRVQIPGSDCFYLYNKSGRLKKECFNLQGKDLFDPNSLVNFYDFYFKVQSLEATILRGEIADFKSLSLFTVQTGRSVILSIWDKINNTANPIKLINDGKTICPDIEMLPIYNVGNGEISLDFFPGDLIMIYLNSPKKEKLLNFFNENEIEEGDNPIIFRLKE